MKKLPVLFTFCFAALSVAAAPGALSGREVNMPVITVTSPAFTNGGVIPRRYGERFDNVSPRLELTGIPQGTKSVAIIVDDPDAPVGVWVHWVMYNLPAGTSSIPEGVSKAKVPMPGVSNGVNSGNEYGYDGPNPPSGTHRYYFKVYALDTVLPDGPGLNKKQLLGRMEGHVLASGELMGTFSR